MGARRGHEYVAGLKDNRKIWYGDQKIDVTEHPDFAGSIAGMAEYFDYQWEYKDDCLYTDAESGKLVSAAHMLPKSQADIEHRHRAFDRFARYSMGMLGRTPDYVNVVLAGHVSRRDIWETASGSAYYERICNYRNFVADNDLALTHTIVHASIDKSVGGLDGMNADLTLQVVDRTDEGIVVRGAKVLATLGPIADEIYVYPAVPVQPGYEQYAISFAVPVETEGVSIICRDHYGVDASREDRPFSSRFDEQDGVVIFDDVLIPHDRVFIDGEYDLELYNAINQGTATGSTQQQTAIRAAVKLEFAYDLLSEMANVTATSRNPETTALLGEVHGYLVMTRAIIDSAERRAHDWGGGAYFVHDDIGVLRTIMPQWMSRVNDIIRNLGSHNLLATPSLGAFDNPELAPILEKYLPGANGVSAQDRARIFRTAWDFAGSALGSRIELYERFYLGSIGRARMLEHTKGQRNGDTGTVREFLNRNQSTNM